MTFQDRPGDLGSRQKRWLDYLWYHNRETFRVAYEYRFQDGKTGYKWTTVDEAICPVDHRAILPNESVFEVDGEDRQKNIVFADALCQHLRSRGITYYIQDHWGRSPHIHLFDANLNTIGLRKNPILRMHSIDQLKLNGSGLAREIGGQYHKKGTYASSFANISDIRPITNPKEVCFPCLKVN